MPEYLAPGVYVEEISTGPKPIEGVSEQAETSLPGSTQDIMQRKFGDDFPKVRIHNDFDAHKSAEALGARAFTVGNDIFFARGSYNPVNAEANPVLAHELAHVALHSPSDNQPVIHPLFGKKEPVPVD